MSNHDIFLLHKNQDNNSCYMLNNLIDKNTEKLDNLYK
jgi:hypothetical protein